MRVLTLIGNALVVVAIASFAAATASAEIILWKWLPGKAGERFKGSSGKVKLQLKGGGTIECKTITLGAKEGELLEEGSTEGKDATLGLAILVFSGCKALGLAAKSLGGEEGTITVHIEIHNCVISSGDLGLVLNTLPVHIEIASTGLLFLVTGALTVLPEAEGVQPTKNWNLNIKQKEGKQEIEKCEGGEANTLLTSTDGGENVRSGEEAKEAKVEFEKAAQTSTFATPTITSLSPNYGPTTGKTRVTITGTAFVSGTTVKFGSSAATEVSVNSSTSITATSPSGTGTTDVKVSNANGTSAPNSHDWFGYEAPSTGHWLGLNGNAVSNAYDGEWLGPVNEFSKEGIVWDRDFDYTAGEGPSEGEKDSEGTPWREVGLKLDHENGMVPLSVVEYKGYEGTFKSDPWFPTATRTTKEKEEGKTTIKEYAEGFVKSVSAFIELINEKYPGMPMYFEPMNEPWGYTTPQFNGTQYASVASEVLTKAKEAGIPLTDIYIAGIGADLMVKEGKEEWYSPGWIPAMYKAVPSLETEVKGWYFHPYGPPTGSEFNNSEGIQSLPEVRKSIKSGAENLIVSEVGYCARAVGTCGGNPQVETGAEAAKLLKEMLTNALPYREAGWLKALVVYSRNDSGWAMQEYPSTELSPSGKALDEFALAHG